MSFTCQAASGPTGSFVWVITAAWNRARPPSCTPPSPTRAPHPGHSPRCYFSLIHVWLVFFMTNRSTWERKERKWGSGLAVLLRLSSNCWMGKKKSWWRRWRWWWGSQTGITDKHSGPQLFPFFFFFRWTPHRFCMLEFMDLVAGRRHSSVYCPAGCQDHFHSHNGRRGRLTCVIFYNKLPESQLIGSAQVLLLLLLLSWLLLTSLLSASLSRSHAQ